MQSGRWADHRHKAYGGEMGEYGNAPEMVKLHNNDVKMTAAPPPGRAASTDDDGMDNYGGSLMR